MHSITQQIPIAPALSYYLSTNSTNLEMGINLEVGYDVNIC